jgi:small-conductance mechanosensitive channel
MLRIAAQKSNEFGEDQEDDEEGTSSGESDEQPKTVEQLEQEKREDEEVLNDRNSPLRRFFFPAALGVIFLFLDIPPETITIVWFVILILFLRRMRKVISDRRKSPEKLPLMERFSFGCSIPFAIISLALTIFGYGRMAILVFMLLFTLVNILILGYAFIELGVILCNNIYSKKTDPVKNSVLRSFVAPITWAISLFSALPWLKAVPGSRYLIEGFLAKGYTVGAASFDFKLIFILLVVFILFRSLKRVFNDSLDHLINTMPQQKMVLQPAKMLLPFIIWSIFTLVGLALLGVNLTGLIVFFSTFSLGVGLAFQGLFQNLYSGLILIFGRSIIVGDWVEVGGITGRVQTVGIRCTIIDTASHAEVMVPNSTIVSNQLINWTRNGKRVRKTVPVTTDYDTDIPLALRLLKEAALEDKERILTTPAPLAVLTKFGDVALEFSLLVSLKDIDQAMSTLSDLLVRIEASFDKNGVKLSRPFLDLFVEKFPEPKNLSVTLDKEEKSPPEDSPPPEQG